LSRRFFILIFYYKISVLSLLVDFFFQFSFSFILKCFSFKMIFIFIFLFIFYFLFWLIIRGAIGGRSPPNLKKSFCCEVALWHCIKSFFFFKKIIEKSFITIPFEEFIFEILKTNFLFFWYNVEYSITKCFFFFFFSNRKITLKGKAMKELKFLLWRVITRFSFVWLKCNYYITSIFFHLSFLSPNTIKPN